MLVEEKDSLKVEMMDFLKAAMMDSNWVDQMVVWDKS